MKTEIEKFKARTTAFNEKHQDFIQLKYVLMKIQHNKY